MGIKDFFKPRKRKLEGVPEKKEVEIPEAPPRKEELPTFPSPEEIPEFKKEVREVEKKKIHSPLEKAEDTAMEMVGGELEEREELRIKKPIFVYLDSYKSIINEVNLIKSTTKEGTDSLARVAEFKEDEDKEFGKWENQIKDIQRKLMYADKTLFKAKE